jgi:hypothetical protein
LLGWVADALRLQGATEEIDGVALEPDVAVGGGVP